MRITITILLLMMTGYFAQSQNELPSDKNATKETVNLYNNLKRVMYKGYLFGHQDDLAYGVNWKYIDKKSDVKDVTGDYPGLFGYDLSRIELNADFNIDTVPFKNIKQYIKQGYKQGSVITISWHGNNPLTGKTAWDNTPGTVASILPGGSKHDVYTADLDKIAAFLADLKDKNGNPIPILYRPFHELTGAWFWWGTKCSTPEELKSIYRFTVHYLRDVKGLHNLLYVYNTSDNFNSADAFLERYPGDDVVDVLSFDAYAYGDPSNGAKFITDVDTHLSIIEQIAKDKNKIPALAEAGYNHIPDDAWFTNVLAKALNNHHPAYVLLWRNAGYKAADKSTEYYLPYPGHASAPDFVKFYELPQTLFQRDAARLKLYK